MTTIARFRVNDSFDDFFRGFFAVPGRADAPAQAGFPVDVTEDDKQYVVRAEIPGVKKDEIQVEIDGNQVAISADVKREAEARDGDRYLRQELLPQIAVAVPGFGFPLHVGADRDLVAVDLHLDLVFLHAGDFGAYYVLLVIFRDIHGEPGLRRRVRAPGHSEKAPEKVVEGIVHSKACNGCHVQSP